MNFALDPSRCPLCGRPNDCQLCTASAYKGPCWCAKIEIPTDLLARVPPDLRNKSCICKACIDEFQEKRKTSAGRATPDVPPVARERAADPEGAAPPRSLLPGDCYFDLGGLMVFTAAYLLRRGYCCDSGCRHCPYPQKKPVRAAL